VSAPSVPLFDVRLSEAEIEAVADTLRSGWLTMGPRTEELERAFAEHLGARHAIALASGTAALHLAYLAAGIGPGDEVIVPGITFVATANAARYCGATPVLADVAAPHHLALDPEDVERRITARTRAVCVVHYGGYAGPLDELSAICERHGLALIEDAAHSPSATAPNGAMLGTVGRAGAFSFFSNKVLSCGEGGLLATNDDEVAATARSLRSHALTSGTWDRHRGHALSYDVVGLGFNYRMDEPRAALLLARLPGLAADIAARRRVVHRYRDALRDVSGVLLPYADDEVDRSSCYVMPILLEEPELQVPLRELMMERWGVQTSLLYPAIHEFTAYAGTGEGLERSERVARSEITLPLYPYLSESDQELVLTALTEGLRELRRYAKAEPARGASSP
jgi:dTDP-4-amino-4,6-dideoxygalactose transaminase